MVNIKAVNPWRWQDGYGFSQGVAAGGVRNVLFCAGQTAVDADGNPLHSGDMAAQLGQAFDNLEAVLAASGLGLANVVRLNYYVTDVPAFIAAGPVIGERLASCTVKPSGTLLGVSRLFHPDILVEIEATAVY